jgi:3-oxoacyl-[acyl-carrier-protein] synthase-3
MDIRNQCSGFIYALSVADAWIQVGLYRHVLVVGAEIQSTSMDVSTAGRNVSVIFADGAAAVVLGPTDDPKRGILGFDMHAEGKHAELLWVDAPGSMYHPRVSKELIDRGQHWLQMDGKEVFKHAVTRMPESVLAVLAKSGNSLAEMKLLVPHQANLRISEMIQKRLELRDDQVVFGFRQDSPAGFLERVLVIAQELELAGLVGALVEGVGDVDGAAFHVRLLVGRLEFKGIEVLVGIGLDVRMRPAL